MITTTSFGRTLREMRLARRITLREFARRLGLSAAYISQVERGDVAMPVEARIADMAHILRTDPDELLAQAGRVAPDLPPIIHRRPREMASFLRTISGLTASQLAQLTRQAEQLKATSEENFDAHDDSASLPAPETHRAGSTAAVG